jgi:hypothetical protein
VPEPRFADEFAEPDPRETRVERHLAAASAPEPLMIAHDDPLRAFGERESEPAYGIPPAAQEPSSGRVLPLALMLIVGLMVGFVVGRMSGEPTPAAVDAAAGEGSPTPPATPVETSPDKSAEKGKAWSEQTVSPPPAAAPATGNASAAPPVPGDAPAGPPPKPVATAGRIVVESTPSRAGVTINDRWSGRTPLTIDPAKFGRYTIRVVQPGYTVSREQFQLSASEPERTLSFRLKAVAEPPTRTPAPRAAPPAANPTAGTVYVDSRPRGARVSIDGRDIGVTPLRLPDVTPGMHVIRLELPGHRAWVASRLIIGGQETRVTGSLDPLQ